VLGDALGDAKFRYFNPETLHQIVPHGEAYIDLAYYANAEDGWAGPLDYPDRFVALTPKPVRQIAVLKLRRP
jgi:hypothetical protein